MEQDGTEKAGILEMQKLHNLSEKFNVIILTEVWIKRGEENRYQMDGYDMLLQDRPDNQAGGVTIYVDASLIYTHRLILLPTAKLINVILITSSNVIKSGDNTHTLIDPLNISRYSIIICNSTLNLSEKFNVIILTEVWIKRGEENRYQMDGYDMLLQDRPDNQNLSEIKLIMYNILYDYSYNNSKHITTKAHQHQKHPSPTYTLPPPSPSPPSPIPTSYTPLHIPPHPISPHPALPPSPSSHPPRPPPHPHSPPPRTPLPLPPPPPPAPPPQLPQPTPHSNPTPSPTPPSTPYPPPPPPRPPPPPTLPPHLPGSTPHAPTASPTPPLHPRPSYPTPPSLPLPPNTRRPSPPPPRTSLHTQPSTYPPRPASPPPYRPHPPPPPPHAAIDDSSLALICPLPYLHRILQKPTKLPHNTPH
ncbi:extensin-2-like [Homalodisca vitripennis]|uniref:extensin-2-like n=1 Tax=Homalodisca vitripennis TaxID=197043 RepID=UPI001EEB437D|nr:extensin-2-like [Homalodisca vitripennis]